jgi:ABC-type multidrug transport system fused ATPase/permease subunit
VGNYLTLTGVQKMALRLRMDLLRHLDQLSADYYESTAPGAVMYLLKEPIEEVAYFGSDLLPALLRMLLTTSFTMTTMFALSPILTLTIVPLIPLFLIARQRFRTKLARNSDLVQQEFIAWNSFLEEHITSVLSIQLLGREKYQERRAFRLLALSTRSQLALVRTGVRLTLWTSMTVVLAMCTVIAFGGWSVVKGTLSLGSLVAFYGFVTQLFDPLSGAAELYARAQKAFASIRQLQTTFAVRPRIVESMTPVQFPSSWDLEFHGVKFGYRDENSLLVPRLRIAAGERVAITGANGAGKSTLARLIPRVYDTRSGCICIGGTDLRNVQLKILRREICYLPRDPVLFDGTLLSNLRFVRPELSDRELELTLQLADLNNIVTVNHQGLHRQIGPDGCQLSGGQRQRLAIARALLQRPKILILDEATSCLDSYSEALILRNVMDHLPASTLIVVSHRASTLDLFGRKLVLAAGSILDADVMARQSSFRPEKRTNRMSSENSRDSFM